MSVIHKFLVAGVLAGSAILPAAAQGAVSFEYVTDQTTYNATAGGQVNVQVFLKETLTSGSPSVIASDHGLSTAGFAVNVSSGTAALGSFTKNAIFAGGSASNDSNNSASHVGGDFTVAAGTTQGAVPDANGLIPLGILTLTAGGVGSTTTYRLGEHDTGGFNTTTIGPTFFDLDFNSGAGGNPSTPVFTGVGSTVESFSVVVPSGVPEPASLSLIAIGAAGLLVRRRRQA